MFRVFVVFKNWFMMWVFNPGVCVSICGLVGCLLLVGLCFDLRCFCALRLGFTVGVFVCGVTLFGLFVSLGCLLQMGWWVF